MTSRAERQRQATRIERERWSRKLSEAKEMKAIKEAELRELLTRSAPVPSVDEIRRFMGVKTPGPMAASISSYSIWDQVPGALESPSPDAALHAIINHIKKQAKGDPDELFRLTGEWMTKVTNALSDLNKHESQE